MVLDRILTKYKDAFARTNTKYLSNNITLGKKDLKSEFVLIMTRLSESSTFIWKRFLHNIELDTVCLDIDAMIWNIDLNNEKIQSKCHEMFKELDKIHGGDLPWEKSIQALQSIGSADIALHFKWQLLHGDGKILRF